MWCYQSPIGLMRIIPINGRYYVQLNGERYGSYSSPAKAADDVSCFAIGCFEWDNLAGRVNPPCGLDKWDKM